MKRSLQITILTLLTLASIGCNTRNNSMSHDTQNTGEAAGNNEVRSASQTSPEAVATPTASVPENR